MIVLIQLNNGDKKSSPVSTVCEFLLSLEDCWLDSKTLVCMPVVHCTMDKDLALMIDTLRNECYRDAMISVLEHLYNTMNMLGLN